MEKQFQYLKKAGEVMEEVAEKFLLGKGIFNIHVKSSVDFFWIYEEDSNGDIKLKVRLLSEDWGNINKPLSVSVEVYEDIQEQVPLRWIDNVSWESVSDVVIEELRGKL